MTEAIITWVLIGAVVTIVIIPPKWDPAIRLKEWVEQL